MSGADIWGLILSYVYAFTLLLLIEQIGKNLRFPYFVTRKIIHIGAGMWTWAIILLFDHWYIGVIPFATFIALNYLFYRFRTFSAMDGEKETPGTIYFAISITILFLLGWRNHPMDYKFLVLPPIMAMTWGDAMASLVGKFWGKHTYSVFGSQKSLEGSAMMFVFSFLAISISLIVLNTLDLTLRIDTLPLMTVLLIGLITSVFVTFAEALSPAGTDNLFVPLIGAGIIYLLTAI